MQRCDRLRGKEGIERLHDVNKSGTRCMTEYMHRMTEQSATASEKTRVMNGKEVLDERLGWSQSCDGHGAVTVGDGARTEGHEPLLYSLTGRQATSRPPCPPSSHELRRSQGRFPASPPGLVVDRAADRLTERASD